jgi:uncharacterized protein (TIGR03435 family)
MLRLTGGASLLFALSSVMTAQSEPPIIAFEVATIKVHEPPLQRIYNFSSSGPRMTLEAYLAQHLIMEAYDLKSYQVSFAAGVRPSDQVYYDVVAKAEEDQPLARSEFRRMLRALLAERCKLEVHFEMKELPVYALVVGRDGPKFRESAVDSTPVGNHGVNGRRQNVVGSKYTMQMLADDIRSSFGVDRPVVDETGLTAAYDIGLEATPEFRLREPEPGDISVFDALQLQLGLRLEARKAMIRVLAVDRWERPSAN